MPNLLHNRIPALARGLAAMGLIAGGILATATAQAASPSSFAESRGYQLCIDAAQRQTRIIKVDSHYFIYDHDASRQYYLNGYAFRDGHNAGVKIACSTTPSGNRVLDLSIDQGRYAGRVAESVNVAQN